MFKKKSWKFIKKQKLEDTLKYRDVYENQQLERTEIGHKQSPILVNIITLIFSGLIFTVLNFGIGQLLVNLFYPTVQPIHCLIGALFITILVGLFMYQALNRTIEAQNLTEDTADINQYKNDQHIALPEEIQRKFDYFPDAGCHSKVNVSSMISHIAISNKGIKNIDFIERYDDDVFDENNDILFYKGEPKLDENGNVIKSKKPLIDTKYMESLFDASDTPKDKSIRKYYDTTNIEYNKKNKNKDKLKGYNFVSDLINEDWELPDYEPQRPAGAYIVDTAPVNTMVLAITRAGKGQTVIEPTIDMWTREINKHNMVINDPKGELICKFYVRGTIRGFEIVQFNLINAMKTDIYNPLGMAAQSAREGDFTKCAMYVENMAEVFFPTDVGEEPMWANAANNAFKRASYGLIDYYIEEERAFRREQIKLKIDETIIENAVDELWGKVTLYNCYQLFVRLSSKTRKNPIKEVENDMRLYDEYMEKMNLAQIGQGDFPNPEDYGKFVLMTEEELQNTMADIYKKAELWNDKPQMDLLTLFFEATSQLPRNEMRMLIDNTNNALKSMASAEKMLSSVYGIATTAMAFFTDPTISTLTSGRPSQNVDLAGLSFPRRISVRFNSEFITKYHLKGLQVKWEAFSDDKFVNSLGDDFKHNDIVTREGWAKYYFKGIFPTDEVYLRMGIFNPQTDIPIRVFYFYFRKNYQTSLDGRSYVKEPILNEKIVKNGILIELIPVEKQTDSGNIFKEYVKGKTVFPQVKIKNILSDNPIKEKIKTPAIISTNVRYSEKPKMVFLVTPPHLMKYAKLILILIKQLVDLNFDQSYMTKQDQKPLFKTRFMLDEVGNLQSEGHGIQGFETMLSIGLGQEQQFTLILQTLQQLRDVYGESVDKIIQGNTSNIVFLKSTDDTMIDTLSKMSGTTHKAFKDQKTITKDMEKLMMQNEGKASYTITTREVPVISFNDMAFIGERNSIVFRAGDSPVWNRNETILPMSYKLFENTIRQYGKEYSLQTLPTLSSAIDFDVRKNQPNFEMMCEKRVQQASRAKQCIEKFKEVYEYTDDDVEKLDLDVYSNTIMELIFDSIHDKHDKENTVVNDIDDLKFIDDDYSDSFATYAINYEGVEELNKAIAKFEYINKKRFCNNKLSIEMLVGIQNAPNHANDIAIIQAFRTTINEFRTDTYYFHVDDNNNLYSKNGVAYIVKAMTKKDISNLKSATEDENTRLFADNKEDVDDINSYAGYMVTDDFYYFLIQERFVKINKFEFARGIFEKRLENFLFQDEKNA